MPEALPELVPLALLLLCFALVWAVRKLLAALFGVVIDAINSAHIPYLGAALNSALHSMEQAVDGALGGVEHGIDGLMGSCWHRFAQLNTLLWDEFKQHTLIGSLLAQAITELSHGYRYLHGRIDSLHGSGTRDAARIKRLEREYRGIEAKIKTLERDLSKGIGADVLPRIKTLEREAANIENVQIPAIQAADAQASDAISNLYDWVRGKVSLIGVGTFSLAVAAALDAIGLGGLRCNSNPLKNKDCSSSVWGDLAGLLSLAAGVLAVTNIETLLKDAQEIEVEVVTLARDVLGLD